MVTGSEGLGYKEIAIAILWLFSFCFSSPFTHYVFRERGQLLSHLYLCRGQKEIALY
jgi:hypothetical protein